MFVCKRFCAHRISDLVLRQPLRVLHENVLHVRVKTGVVGIPPHEPGREHVQGVVHLEPAGLAVGVGGAPVGWDAPNDKVSTPLQGVDEGKGAGRGTTAVGEAKPPDLATRPFLSSAANRSSRLELRLSRDSGAYSEHGLSVVV